MEFDKKITVILVFLIALAVSSHGDNGACKKARIFRKHRRYWYSYVGTVENGIKGASENAARMRISATVAFDYVNTCEYSMELKNVKVEESFGALDNYRLTATSATTAKSLQQYPLRFVIDNGMIKDLQPVLTERQKDILNIKRGILSAFQVKWSKKSTSTETDVSGVCNVRYSIIKHKTGSKYVKKVKDLSSCDKRTLAHSNIETVQYKQVSSIYNAASFCEYSLVKKNEIEKVVCNEFYMVRPFSTPYGAGSYTNVSQVISLQRIQRMRFRTSTSSQEVYRTSLLYEHDREEKPKSADISKAVTVLHKLVQSRKNSPLIASYFAELIYAFRAINEQGMGKLLSILDKCFDSAMCNEKTLPSYRSFFFDGLSQCGTGACVNVISSLIISKKVPSEQIDNVLIALNFIQVPSPSMINAVMGIYRATKNPTSLLLLGTLMHKLCKHRPQGCIEKGTIRNVIKDAEFFLMRLLGNDCRSKEKDRIEVIYYTLKAIGNAGRPVQMKTIITDCLWYAADTKISIAALGALRRMDLDPGLTYSLRATLIDRNVDPEKRMESFLLLMKNPTESEIILSKDMANDESEAHQIRSFIQSFLLAASKNKDPSKKRLSELANKYKVYFNPPASRFSKFYGNSFFNGYVDAGAGYKGYTIFHPESFMPRSMRLAIETQILGHSVDILDVSARMVGLEMQASKVLGDKGYFSKDFMKKIFEIPENVESNSKSRQRRNTGENTMWTYIDQLHDLVNMRDSNPDMEVSIKVFGNEIKLLKLKDIPLLNGALDDLNILKTLYSLTKGKSASLQRNCLFLEGKFAVPTVIGLPLAFEINGSASVSLNLDGKVEMKNLIFGPKMVTLQGSAVPSATLDISGKVTVHGISSKAGLRFHSKTHASSKISGEVEYKEGTELKIKVDVPDNAMDMFSYSHEMYHVISANELRITGAKKRTKLDICSNEFSNVSKHIGLDICTDFDFPVAYHDLTAPFYPLTGPASIRFWLQKTDASLKLYYVNVVRKNDIFEVDIGTPGALLSRRAKLKLGIAPLGQRGMIGATFGTSNQGFLFNYEYDNNTNGLKTNFKWNITGREMVASANFYNETDPATLDMKIGLDLNFKSPYLSGKSKLSFVDTYGYWGIDWLVDLGKKPLHGELKVAYNPQTVFTRFVYGGKSFAIQLVPAFPLISYDMQINWYPAIMNFTMKADLIKRKINIVSNTSMNSYSGEVHWEKANSRHKLVITAERNQEVLKWLTHVNYGDNRKLLITKLHIGGQDYGIRGEIKNTMLEIKAIGFPAKVQAVVSRTSRVKTVSIFWNVSDSGGHLMFYLHNINRMGERKVCGLARSSNMYYTMCVSATAQDSTKKALKFEYSTSGRKSSVEILHSILNPKDSDSAVTKDVYTMKAKSNDKTGFFSRLEIDQNAKKYTERISSFVLQLPVYGFDFNMKVPTTGIFTRRENATGGITLKFWIGQASHLFNMNIENSLLSIDVTQMKLGFKFTRNRVNCTDIISYTEKNELNSRTGSNFASREGLILFCNNVQSFQDHIAVIRDKGQVKWETRYKSTKIGPILPGAQLMPIIKKKLEFVEPIVSTKGELIQPNLYSAVLYPTKIRVNFFDSRVNYDMDLVKRMARLNLKLPKLNSTIRVNYSEPNRYEIVADNSVTVGRNSVFVNRTRVVVKKAKEGRFWEVRIQHPNLKNLIQSLKSIFHLDYKKYEVTIFNISKELISKMKLSSAMQTKVSNLLMEGTALLLKNATMAVENLESKWRILIREIVDEQIENALKKPNPFGISDSKLSNRLKSLIPRVSDLVESALTFDKLKLMFETDRTWQAAKKSLIEIAKSRDFKRMVMNGARRALMRHGLSFKTRRVLLRVINKAISDLDSNDELPVLMLSYISHQFNTTLFGAGSPSMSFYNAMLRSLNVTGSEKLHILSDTERVFNAIFEEIDRKTSFNEKIKKILQKPYGSHNVSNVLREFASINDFIHRLNSNTSNGPNLVEKGKRILQRKLMSVAEFIPNRWRLRLDPIIKKLIAAISLVKYDDIASNATEVLFNIGEISFNSIYDYMATNFSSDIENDLKVWIYSLPPQALFGNLTLPQYWKRSLHILRERFFFGLRLIAQVFPKQVQYFKREYLRSGKILLEKMYRDFARKNFVAPRNIAKLQKMFSNVGKMTFIEMSQATGNFSTGGFMLNLLKFAKDADLKDFNSVIRSYEKIKKMRHQEWSLSVLISHLKDILKSFGKMKIGNQILNKHLGPIISDFNGALTKMIKKGRALEKLVKRAFVDGANNVVRVSNLCRDLITKYASVLDKDSAKWQKLVKFGSELTIPSLGMTRKAFKQMLKKEKFAGNKSELYRNVESFMKNDPFNLTSYVIDLIESTDELPPEKMLKTILTTLGRDVQNVQNFAIKRMKIIEGFIIKHQREVRSILTQVKRFLAKKSKQPLHKLIQKSIRLVMSYLRSSYANSSILNDLQMDFGSIYDFAKLRQRMDSVLERAKERTETAFKSFDVKKLQIMAYRKLPSLLQGLASHIARGVVLVLKKIDASKGILLTREYLVNPKGYLLNLPKLMMVKIRQQLMEKKAEILRWLSYTESLIKRHIMERKMIGAVYMKRIQSYFNYFDKDLKRLDYFAVMYKLMRKITEERILSNYTSKFKHELTTLQSLFDDAMKTDGKSLLTLGTGRKLQEMFGRVNSGDQSGRHISSFINKLTVLARKGVDNMRQALHKNPDWKTQATRRELYEVMRKIEKRVKMLQTDFSSFVKMIDDSTMVLLVPEIDVLQNKLIEFFSLDQNKFSSMDTSVRSSQKYRAKQTQAQYPGAAPVDAPVRSPLQSEHVEQSSVPYSGAESFKGESIRTDGSSEEVYNYQTSHAVSGGNEHIVNGTVVSMLSSRRSTSDTVILKSLLQRFFMVAGKSFDFIYNLPATSAAVYQEFVAKLQSDFDNFVRSTYTKQIVVPLKRISEVATIPIPAEKLQSIMKERITWKKAKKLFTPISATATFFNGHVITFDGKYVYLPLVADGCTYLLSRDFRDGSFTFLIKNGQLHIYIGRMSVVLSRNGNIALSSWRGIINNNLPAEIERILVRTTGKWVEIISPFGLTVKCNSRLFMCEFVVPGIFHNKTLGIFGSNNAEFADDFKLPSGLIAVDLLSFLNSWKVKGKEKCQSLNEYDFDPVCRRPSPSQQCFDLFKSNQSPFSKAFNLINPTPYFLSCKRETSCSFNDKSYYPKYCTVASLYARRAFESGIVIEKPAECNSCRIDGGLSQTLKLNSKPRSVEIVLIVRDSIYSKRALRNLKPALQRVNNLLSRLKIDVRYTMVGFGGIAYRFNPYIQTGLNKVSGDINNLLAATNNLQYKNTIRIQNGLDALKFASNLDLRPLSTKIFIVLDTVAVYSGSLRQMIEANNMLINKGIILNVINKYRFKKGVIGQDSFNVRYHLKIPRGERLRNLLLHTSDDYVPIVKDSGGAIMTVKGLVSSNEKWIKAFPISLKQIILNQIKRDGIACKSCSCVKDGMGHTRLQCVNTNRNNC